MKTLFSRFVSDESGATAIEYGLIAALVAVAIIAAFGGLRGGLTEVFQGVGNKLSAEAAKINKD